MPEPSGDLNNHSETSIEGPENWLRALPAELLNKFDISDLLKIKASFEIYEGPLPVSVAVKWMEDVLPGSGREMWNDVLRDSEAERQFALREQENEIWLTKNGLRGSTALSFFGTVASIGVAILSILKGNNFGLAFAALLVIATVGGPIALKLLIERFSLNAKKDDNLDKDK